MPDLADRLDRERELSTAMRGVFRQWEREPGQIAIDRMEDDTKRATAAILLLLYADSAEQMFSDFRLPITRDQLTRQAERWASDYSRALGREIGTTTLDKLRELQGLPADERAARLDESGIFGTDRADRIGTTETTRGVTAGERGAKGEIERELGVTLVAMWITARDSAVCPVCAPLNNQREEAWNFEFPSGPPAHVNCRCFLKWEVT